MTKEELAALWREVHVFEGLKRVSAELVLAEIRRCWAENERLSQRVKRLEARLARAGDTADSEHSWAVKVLERIEGAGAVLAFCEAMSDENPMLRLKAAEALGRLGDTHGVPFLIEALDDPTPSVRREAVRGLGNIRDAQAVLPLCEVVKGGSQGLGPLALDSLVKIGEAAVLPLCEVAGSGSISFRETAIRLLGAVGDGRAVPTLCLALGEKDIRLRTEAAAALASIAERCHAPETRKALQQLQRLQRRRWLTEGTEVDLYGQVIQRIETSTAEWRSLVLPSSRGRDHSDRLLLPHTPSDPGLENPGCDDK
jgi:HEAT repeat protein